MQQVWRDYEFLQGMGVFCLWQKEWGKGYIYIGNKNVQKQQ